MVHARILIRNKPGVFDPQGKVVQTGLERLGHTGVGQVSVGKIIDLHFDAGSRDELTQKIRRMCEQFLVNPVIEDYQIEFLDEYAG